jgi:hypothetical protein
MAGGMYWRRPNAISGTRRAPAAEAEGAPPGRFGLGDDA